MNVRTTETAAGPHIGTLDGRDSRFRHFAAVGRHVTPGRERRSPCAAWPGPACVRAARHEPCPAGPGSLVYRLVQTALTNVDEHSGAASASITVACLGSRLSCAISDDGAGFDVTTTLGRYADRIPGLLLILDRIEAAGGTLDITSAPRHGTHLRARIPLEF